MFSNIFNVIRNKAFALVGKASIEQVIEVAETVTATKRKGKISQTIESQRTTKTKEPAWQKWFPFSFFFGGGKFQPIYFFVFVFSSLGAWMLYIKCHAASIAVSNGTFTPAMISTADLGLLFSFIGGLIILYNGNKKTYIKSVPKQENEVREE